MEIIKLANGQEFEIIPVGIISNDITKRRTLCITSQLPYSEIEAALSNSENFKSIQYIIGSGEVLTTYSDCVSLKTLSKDMETGVYSVEYGTDAVEAELKLLRAQVAALTAH